MAVRKIQLPDGTVENVNDSRLHIYRTLTGTAAVTSSPYYCSRWDVTDDTVTAYEDGMVVWLEVPVAGNGSYGTCLQINSLGYKPVVYNVNTMISSRYSVGSMVLACYNATQTATAYFNSGSATTVTGCWQVMDYDTNTTSISNLYHPRATRVVTGGQLKRYVMCVEADETGIIPLNYTGTTATTKTMTTEAFDPTREILYYTTNATVAENNSVALSGCFYSNTSVDARYTFNSGTTLTANRELYMVLDVQSDGRLCKLASTPWSQTLPTTDDGHVYLLLGYAYDTYHIELYPHHPMFKHDGTSLNIWHGTIPSVPTNVSSFTNDAGYLTEYDFKHTENTTVSDESVTITFAANTRGSQMITVSADIGITFAVNNFSDNYLWIANSGSAEIDVTVSAVTLDGTSVSDVYVPTDGITVPAGGVCELGIIANSDGAFITSRNDLAI